MSNGGQPSKPKKIQLYEERGETSRHIDVEVTEDGNLVMSGQDVGKAPQEWWGDADYEFWVFVPGEHKDEVLLALIEQVYGNNPSAIEEFRALLESQGISFEFGTWV